jgi:beta-glucosidase
MGKYESLIKEMTLEEKASLLSGATFWLTRKIDRLGVPQVWMADGPHGLRKEQASAGTNIMKPTEPATCFPTAVTTASSWDPDLLYKMGEAIAEEALHYDVTTVLGPGVNIKRSPLCGRNFEYFSEDPYLAGEMATAWVHGLQSKGVGASLKHYAGNNQEYIRMSIDARIDERTLREIYLPAFEATVKKAQPYQVMCSYNRLNGTYLSDNKRMLTDILRDEWGFKGIVVSDWGAVNDRVAGVLAGLDLEMPGNGGLNDRVVVKAVKEGRLSEADVDVIVERMLDYIFKCKAAEKPDYKCDFAAHHNLARKVAAESAVLLKNNGALPLEKSDKIAVIGRLAEEVRYQGSGSSHINPKNLRNFLSVLDENGVSFSYARGYGFKGDGFSQKLIDEAVEAAKDADKVIVFAGLTSIYESEGFDRSHIEMPAGHLKLIEALSKRNRNIIVVLMGGSPVALPFIGRVNALLNMYLGGEAVAEAAYDLLTGAVNPSGKLAETYPVKNSDNISHTHFPMGPRTVEYREGIFVGYRYFDTAGVPVQFPFGFGLSYTEFEYSDFKLSKSEIDEGEELTATFKVKNIGMRDGAEIAQIYVHDAESTLFKAEKELRGFKKVFLKAGEEKEVSITLEPRAFQYYNVLIKDWHVESGEFKIMLASSSRDIKQVESVYVKSKNPDAPIPDYRESAPAYYDIKKAGDILKEQFKAVYGGELPENTPIKKGEFDVNSTVQDIAAVRLGRFIRGLLSTGAKLIAGKTENKDMVIRSVDYMPVRSFSSFTGGLLSMMTVRGLVDMLNGTKGGFRKFLRGFKKCNK